METKIPDISNDVGVWLRKQKRKQLALLRSVKIFEREGGLSGRERKKREQSWRMS